MSLCSDLRDKLDGWGRRTYQRGEWQAQIFFEDANLKRKMEAVTLADEPKTESHDFICYSLILIVHHFAS